MPSGRPGERFQPALSLDPGTAEAVWAFTLANAIPFIGSASQAWRKAVEALFGAGPVPPAIYLFSLGQGIVNTLLLFLLALALRNYFKVN